MKIIDAINRLDSLKQNTYSQSDKIRWLSTLDWMVKKQVIDNHEGADEVIFTGYDKETDVNTELLVPTPYDEMYLRWLEAQIDYTNGEYRKYNNSITVFNTLFDAFASYYTRDNMPIHSGRRFLF